MSEVKRYYSFFTSHPGDWRPTQRGQGERQWLKN